MTTEEYEKRAAALGIDRGVLAQKFESEPNVISHFKEPTFFSGSKAKRTAVKPPLEDLSHLNPERTAVSQKTGRMAGWKGARAKKRANLAKAV